jgi:hypothetical protein
MGHLTYLTATAFAGDPTPECRFSGVEAYDVGNRIMYTQSSALNRYNEYPIISVFRGLT